jgi:RNA polymerase sigma-70 factor (ECF subfamily)
MTDPSLRNAFADEDELVRQAINGDSLSLQALLHRYQAPLLAYIRRNLPSSIATAFDPEDVLQDMCVEAVRRISDFKPKGPDAIVRWLMTIARNRMVSLVREVQAQKRGGGIPRQHEADGDSEFDAVTGLLRAIAVYGRTPSRSAIAHELVFVIHRVLEQLSEDQRQAIQLRHIEGLAAKDAAVRMNRTEGAFHLLCNRGLKELRQELRSKSYYV